MQNAKPNYVAVISSGIGATGDLISNILVGSKNSLNQGLVSIGTLPTFRYQKIDSYSGRQAFQAAVKGIYTFDPNVTPSITNFSFNFNFNGYAGDYPNADRQEGRVIVSVGLNETLTNAQLCARVVSVWGTHSQATKFYTAATSGSGDSMVVLFTEVQTAIPYARTVPSYELFLSNGLSTFTFSKTTATVPQFSFTGQQIVDFVINEYGDTTEVDTGTISLTGLYSCFEIIFDRNDVLRPQDYRVERTYRYFVYVLESATNAAVFYAKLDAVFNLDARTAFVASAQNTGDTITPTDPVDLPAAGQRINFITAPTGLAAGIDYYAITITGTTFQVALTVGGSALAVTADTVGVSYTISNFIPYTYYGGAQNTGDTITPTAVADIPALDDEIVFLVAPTGIIAGKKYYAITITGTTFQVSLTKGGAAVAVTADTTIVTWTKAWGGLPNANDVFAIAGRTV